MRVPTWVITHMLPPPPPHSFLMSNLFWHKFAVSAKCHAQGHPEIGSATPTHSTGFSSAPTQFTPKQTHTPLSGNPESVMLVNITTCRTIKTPSKSKLLSDSRSSMMEAVFSLFNNNQIELLDFCWSHNISTINTVELWGEFHVHLVPGHLQVAARRLIM